jgi:serine/threonine protein kinase
MAVRLSGASTRATMIGPYEVLGTLGSGGMGDVFLAKTATASKVAIKVIRRHLARDPEVRARFMSEVDHLRMAFGARVAGFEDADLDAEEPWLAVQYVPGVTLREHVELHGPLPADLAPILGAVLAEGLEAIHKAGLVHRDLKPQNIIMGLDGPVIIDFGLAVLVDRDEHLTLTGHAVGTPAYMPPEQARGETDLTGAADIYALGATLVAVLTGHPIYPPQGLIGRILDPDDMPDVSGLPAEIAALVGRMLAHDPAQRPTASVVKATLVAIVVRGHATATTLRARLAATTYVDTVPALPSDVDDPWTDPEDMIDDVPTELVPVPTAPAVPPRPVPSRDVSKLVESIRKQYSRGGSL